VGSTYARDIHLVIHRGNWLHVLWMLEVSQIVRGYKPLLISAIVNNWMFNRQMDLTETLCFYEWDARG
jgi:hypothetical protein